MPLVRIDVGGSLTDQLVPIGEAVHAAMIAAIAVPDDDRFQVLTSRPDPGIVADAGYLGVARTGRQIVIQITLNAGRSDQAKRDLYAAIARGVSALGIPASDVFVSLVEVQPIDWSFGDGLAQYALGDADADVDER